MNFVRLIALFFCAYSICGARVAASESSDGEPFTPAAEMNQPQKLFPYLIAWLEENLADAHRVYPVRGDVKSVTVGEGYSILGERKFSIDNQKRISERAVKTTEYSLADKKRHQVLLATKYIFDDDGKLAESRVYCNGTFFERHVYELAQDRSSVERYSYYPDGTREKKPTAYFSYDPEASTFRKSAMYIFHEEICDPRWSITYSDDYSDTTFMFDSNGFVEQIISGTDPEDNRYLHWRFTSDEYGYLKDTFLMPDTHQYREEIADRDAHGNPAKVVTYETVTNFGTIDFDYYGDTAIRWEYHSDD